MLRVAVAPLWKTLRFSPIASEKLLTYEDWKLAGLEKSEKFSSLVWRPPTPPPTPAPPKDVERAEILPEQNEGSWKEC